MNERDDIGTRLTRALHEEAERVRPEPRLQSILARTRQAPARRSRGWPVLAGVVASGGLVAAFAFVALDDEASVEPPIAATSSVELYFINRDGKLVSERATAPDTGNPGLDAVTALLVTTPADPDYTNIWSRLEESSRGIVPEVVASVTASQIIERDGVIAVDFSGPVDNPWGDTVDLDWAFDPRLFSQQLVWTVQGALDSDAPVLLTMAGNPVKDVLTARVDMPVRRDAEAQAPIQIQSPRQGDALRSPVTVEGIGRGFEGTISWRVLAAEEVVKEGFTTGGAMADLEPFSFDVRLPAGDYTIEAFEYSAENGKVINLDTKDFTVE